MRFEEGEFVAELLCQAVGDAVGMGAAAVEQRPPAHDRQGVRALQRKVLSGEMELGQRSADRRAMLHRDAAWRQPVQERRDGGRPAGQLAHGVAVAAVDRLRAVDAARRQMIHQAEEERQVLRIDALLVERQEVLPAIRRQQVVGVLDAFGNALQRVGAANVVFGEECLELGIADVGVDRHQATSWRGSLKTTLSSVVRTSSTVTS